MNTQNMPDSAPPAPTAAQTPGSLLRAAREARGMHLGMLAVTLKVPTRQLEALENDQYEVFRGPAFVRATAQALCRHLGIDPAPVLAGLPQNATSMAVQPTGIESPARPALRSARLSRGPGLSRQVLLLGVLMLLGTAALIWWPAPAPSSPELSGVPQDPLAPASAAEVPVSVNVPSVPEGSASEPALVASVPVTVPNTSPATAALQARAVPAPAVVAPVAAQTPAPQAQSSSVRKTDGKSDMQIAATGDTWLEVRDARGQLVVNRLLKAGETQPVDLPPPFSVVVGRAHLAKVTQGGKDFDLTPHTKSSTARFEIQP